MRIRLSSAIVLCAAVLALAGVPEARGCTATNPSPASIQAGSGATPVTINAAGFGSDTGAVLEASSPPTPITLPVTFVGPTQIQVTLPAAFLAVPQTDTILLFSAACGSLPITVTVQVTSAVPLASLGTPNAANAHIPVTVPTGAKASSGRAFWPAVSGWSGSYVWSRAVWTSCEGCHGAGGVSDGAKWVSPFNPHEVAAPNTQRIFNWTAINDELHDFERVPGTSGVGGGKTASEVQNFVANALTQPGGLRDYHLFNPVVEVNPNTGGQTTVIPLFREYRPGSYALPIYAICSSQVSAAGDVAKGCSLSVEKTLTLFAGGAVRMEPGGQGITYGCSTPCASVTPGDASTLVFGSDGSAIITYPNQIKEYYSTSGHLVRVFDPRGPDVQIIRDSQDDSTSITDNFGIRISITRGSNAVTLGDQGGRSVKLSRSSTGSLDAFTNAGGDTYQFTGGPVDGSFSAIIDPNGGTTGFGFTGNRISTITNPLGGIKSFVYFSSSTKVTDEVGDVSTYQFDSKYRTTSVTNGVNATYSMTFGSNGVLAALTDPLGFVRSWQTDGNLNIKQYTDQAGHTTLYFHDANNNQTGVKDALGNQANAVYGSNNLPVSATDFLSKTTTYTYDPKGRETSKTLPDSTIDTNAWDDTNNTVTTTLAAGTAESYVVKTQFDGNGRLVVRNIPNRVDHAAWDANNQLVQLVLGFGQSDARTFTFLYDPAGNLIGKITPRGVKTNLHWDPWNDLAKVDEAVGLPEQSVTIYGHNLAGDKTSEINPIGGVTSLTRDADHQVVKVVDPLGLPELIQRDLDGRPIQITDRDGKVVVLKYSPTGQVIEKDFSDSNTVTITYDVLDRRSTMTDSTGITIYQHDADDRLTNVRDAAGKSVGSEYDAVGNLAELTLPDGTKIKYHYSPLGLADSLTAPLLGKILVAYDSGLNANQMTFPNGLIFERTFDSFHQPTQEMVTRGSHEVSSSSFTYDVDGDGVSDIIHGVPDTRTFDALRRVTSESSGGVSTPVFWDANSDMLFKGSNAFTYNIAGWLTGFDSATLSNDANGRLLNGLGLNFTYTAAGDVNTVSGPTSTAAYTPNGDGALTDEATSKGSYHYVYGGAYRLVQESGPDGTITYLRLGEPVVATINTTTGQIFTPAYGAAGSPTDVFDGAGKVVWQPQFDFLGNPLSSNSLGSEFKLDAFGCVKDPGSGLLRCSDSSTLYDPQPGRTIDQATFGGLWPPNHGYQSLGLNECCPIAMGPCSTRLLPLDLARGILSITSNEPLADGALVGLDPVWLNNIVPAGAEKGCGAPPLPPGHDENSWMLPSR